MLMHPFPVWPAELHIGKAVWRIPIGDFGLPADGDSAYAQLVVNQGSWAHLNGPRCHNAETQERRCNSFQITSLSEKSEGFFKGGGQPLAGGEDQIGVVRRTWFCFLVHGNRRFLHTIKEIENQTVGQMHHKRLGAQKERIPPENLFGYSAAVDSRFLGCRGRLPGSVLFPDPDDLNQDKGNGPTEGEWNDHIPWCSPEHSDHGHGHQHKSDA